MIKKLIKKISYQKKNRLNRTYICFENFAKLLDKSSEKWLTNSLEVLAHTSRFRSVYNG